jgi:hypothetical protein
MENSLESMGGPLSDRIKGNADSQVSTELRAYLKTNPESLLGDQAAVSAGNTIQLAYTVGNEFAGDSTGERYGVIFSIDGRGAVTLHYPYTPEGKTRLTVGKQMPLEEAYTLDDAPNYEMFFFVIAGTPLDAGEIMRTAEKLSNDPKIDPRRYTVLFTPYEVKSLTLLKMEGR